MGDGLGVGLGFKCRFLKFTMSLLNGVILFSVVLYIDDLYVMTKEENLDNALTFCV